MKLLDIKTLPIKDIKVIKFARFCDDRGYFTESYRKSDFDNCKEINGITFVQCNESYSKSGTIRGLHFQWNPYMGKLVRTITGRMIDMILDIRKGSTTFGKIVLYDMPSKHDYNYDEWIWIPPGFAHGNFFTEDTIIEYLCSGEYSPGCEAGISPLSSDIDWSICEGQLKNLFDNTSSHTELISDKDKDGLSVNEWVMDEKSNNFIYAGGE